MKTTPSSNELIADLVRRLGRPGRRDTARYCYRIERGEAVLNRGDSKPLKRIGKFASDQIAKQACERHFNRACWALKALGKEMPMASYT